MKKNYNRVIAAGHNCHTGICSGSAHLHTAYQAALESLKLVKYCFQTSISTALRR